jgi:hypothetical protein
MDLTTAFCPHWHCPARGQIGQGNIGSSGATLPPEHGRHAPARPSLGIVKCEPHMLVKLRCTSLDPPRHRDSWHPHPDTSQLVEGGNK